MHVAGLLERDCLFLSILSCRTDNIHLSGTKFRDNRPGRPAASACTKDQDLFPCGINTQPVDQGFHSIIVCIITAEFSLSVDDRINSTDAAGKAADLFQIRNDHLCIWDRNVDSLKLFCTQEGPHFLGCKFLQIIVAGSYFFVDHFGKTV